MRIKQKLYCYVDETGQDTRGEFFLVAVVLKGQADIEILQKKLVEAEKFSKKNLLKWTKTSFEVRKDYLLRTAEIKQLRSSIFYSTYKDTKEYVPLISLTIAKSILFQPREEYTVNIVIDGLNKKEMEKVRRELKKLKISYRKIRGMKDEQDAVLRLADSIAGFLRDYTEKQRYTQKIIRKFREAKVIIEV